MSLKNKRERVFVSGIGVISPIGCTYLDFSQSLFSGKVAIAALDCFSGHELRYKTAAPVKNFFPEQLLPPSQLMLLNRPTAFTIVAAKEAIKNSAIDPSLLRGEKTAIVFGGLNPSSSSDYIEDIRSYFDRNETRANPLSLLRYMPHAAVAHLSIEFGVKGPGYVIQSGCASATQAIGQCYEQIANGQISRAITGGSDSSLGLHSWRAWESIGAMAPDFCRPFSKNRSGTSVGEGGICLLLESESELKKRNGKAMAEILGFFTNSDAHDLTKPSQGSVEELLNQILAIARLNPTDIQHINAHASGTKLNDKIEAGAIRKIFGDAADSIVVSGTKSQHGHLMTACGAIEAAATVFAIENQFAPGTMNMDEKDPECDIKVLANKGAPLSIHNALCTSLGFGGTNAAIIFSRPS